MVSFAATADVGGTPERAPAWGAVYALSLCTFVLIASEFMPISLLSPIAHDLSLTDGQAGQAIAISGIFAVFTSLFITKIAGSFDRRRVLIALTALLIISSMLTAIAPSYLVLMVARAFVGIAVGGFWSMSAATVMRLVPEKSVAKGLAILNGGNAIATTVAAPLGNLMGGLVGWRGAFLCVVPIAVAAVVWQVIALPSLPVAHDRKKGGSFSLLRNPVMLVGLLAVSLFFMGQFALYTYLRPFLEQVTQVGVGMLSAILLVIGVMGLAGTAFIGPRVDRRLTLALVSAPASMAVLAVALALFGQSLGTTIVLLGIWGFIATGAPVGWWTWVTRAAPDDAEAGGGLMVAVIQLAITLGATIGGLVYDRFGAAVEFIGSAAILAVAAVAALCSAKAMAQRAR